jgi:undecaprenyl-diphosphatase
MTFLLVHNPSSGSGAGDLTTRAQRELNDVRSLELAPGVDLGREIGVALHEGHTVVACGGDGTVNAVAQHVAGTEGLMAVLPAGTLNHFARDVGVEDADTALTTLVHGDVARIDVGRAGERVFVNTLGFGIYPEVVRERAEAEHRLGRWFTLASSVARVAISFDALEGRIAADGRIRELKATAVFVGNNRFSTSPGSIGRRQALDEGLLDVRVVRARVGLLGRASAGWRVAISRPRRVIQTVAREVEVRLREPRLMAVDGEQDREHRSVRIRIEPAALRILVPPAD